MCANRKFPCRRSVASLGAKMAFKRFQTQKTKNKREGTECVGLELSCSPLLSKLFNARRRPERAASLCCKRNDVSHSLFCCLVLERRARGGAHRLPKKPVCVRVARFFLYPVVNTSLTACGERRCVGLHEPGDFSYSNLSVLSICSHQSRRR